MKKGNEELMSLILSQLEKIDRKVDRLDERLDASDKTLVRNTASLEEHMRRSDLLEGAQVSLAKDVKPLLTAYVVVWGIGRIVVGLGVVFGIVKVILQLMPS